MKLLLPFTTLLASTLAANVRTVYQFPGNTTWLENITQMRNSSLLVTVLGKAEVWMINPTNDPVRHVSTVSSNPGPNPPAIDSLASASRVASFPAPYNAAFGITELGPNVFAVGVGTLTPTNAPVPSSFAVWKIDLSNCKGGDSAVVTKIADTPNVGLINGIAKLNDRTILLADSWNGNIVDLNVETAKYSVALAHPFLRANFSAPGLPLGVNGIKLRDNYLYFSNTVQNLLGRVHIDRRNAQPKGKWEILAAGQEVALPDDFAVPRDGSVWLVTGEKGVVKVGLDGRVGERVDVAGATAAWLGIGGKLFVSSGVGTVAEVDIFE